MIIAFSGKIGSGKDTSMLMAAHCIANIIDSSSVGLTSSAVIEIINNKDKDNKEKLLDYYLNKSGFEKAYFGKNVKKIACILLGCTLEQLEDINFKNSLAPEIYTRYRLLVPDYDIDVIFESDESAHDFYDKLPTKSTHSVTQERPTVRDFLVMIGNDFGRDMIHPNIWSNLLFEEYKGEHNLAEKIGTPRELPLIYPNWFITDCRYKNEADNIVKHGGTIIRLTRKTEQPEHIAKSQSETDLDNFEFEHVIDNSDGDLYKLYDSIKEIITKIYADKN